MFRLGITVKWSVQTKQKARRLSCMFVLMLKRFFSFFVFVSLSAALQAQEPSTDIKTIYKKEIYGGAFLHTQGYGANLRQTKFISVDRKNILSIELSTMKHAKEFKTYNPYFEDRRGFVYGKKNSLTVLRPAIGRQKIHFQKLSKRGVQISSIYMGGASIGIVKPVYLVIVKPASSGGDSQREVLEKYNENEHQLSMIKGRGPMLKGLEESEINAGLNLKYALNFEYAPSEEKYTALEVGLDFELFYKPVRIMAFDNDQQAFLTLYANLQFGKKYLR